MKSKSLWWYLATLHPVGQYKGRGTWASLFTYIIAYGISYGSFGWGVQCTIATITALVSIGIISQALIFFTTQDPKEIVFDELVGSLVALIGITAYSKWYAISFCLFRFFDITKLGGIAYTEKLPGAWGIVVDDVLAGLYASIGTVLVFLFTS